MTERVVDASALAFALLDRGADARALRAVLAQTACHAPYLVDAELGNVLRRRVRAGDLTAVAPARLLDLAGDVVDVRHEHVGPLARLAWRWRDNLSFYDALYVALAATLGVPLVTADRRLAGASHLPCAVELV